MAVLLPLPDGGGLGLLKHCVLCIMHGASVVLHGAWRIVRGKAAGIDKKLSRSVEQEVVDALAASPMELAASPVGPLSTSQSRKTLVYLILTLNHVYPDYDFSTLRSHHFSKESGPGAVKDPIDQLLREAAKLWEEEMGSDVPFADALWSSIDDVIQLSECDVYSYQPDVDTDIFTDSNSIWSFNYFFYNRKLKRVLYFTCRCRSKVGAEDSSSEEGESVEDYADMAADMDL
ncbi:unnamed protein product [Closterium sp. NIES-54]